MAQSSGDSSDNQSNYCNLMSSNLSGLNMFQPKKVAALLSRYAPTPTVAAPVLDASKTPRILESGVITVGKQAAAPSPKPVKARYENSEDGICPYCNKAMAHTSAKGIDSFICWDDRYVAPCPQVE